MGGRAESGRSGARATDRDARKGTAPAGPRPMSRSGRDQATRHPIPGGYAPRWALGRPARRAQCTPDASRGGGASCVAVAGASRCRSQSLPPEQVGDDLSHVLRTHSGRLALGSSVGWGRPRPREPRGPGLEGHAPHQTRHPQFLRDPNTSCYTTIWSRGRYPIGIFCPFGSGWWKS